MVIGQNSGQHPLLMNGYQNRKYPSISVQYIPVSNQSQKGLHASHSKGGYCQVFCASQKRGEFPPRIMLITENGSGISSISAISIGSRLSIERLLFC